MYIGTIIIFDQMATILFDLSSTYSYVSFKFSLGFDLVYDLLHSPIHVSTSIGDFLIVTHVYHTYSIFFRISKPGWI